MRSPPGFDEFVDARSPRLLRTAYLLTRDWAVAEDLLQTALARAWGVWRRIQGTLRVLIEDVEVAEHTWWDYRQVGYVERLDSLCSELVDGDEVTIAVVPEHMTGDWQVLLNRSGG